MTSSNNPASGATIQTNMHKADVLSQHRHLCLFISCLLLFFSSPQSSYSQSQDTPTPIKVEAVASKTACLLNFIIAIAGSSEYGPMIKAYYEKHHKVSDKDKELLNNYYNVSFNYQRKQSLRPDGPRLDPNQTLEVLSVQSANEKEFLENASHRLSPADYAVVKQCFQHFGPIYEKLIWNKCKERLTEQVNSTNAFIKEKQIDTMLSTINIVMGNTHPQDLPLKIALIPIPYKAEKNTKDIHYLAHTIDSVQLVEVLDNENMNGRYVIIFHELCHSILTNQANLQKQFFALGYKGALAYEQLHEALPVALSSGWYSKKTTGKTANFWYEDKYIETYAKDLYPLLKAYLDKDHPLDSKFVENAVAILWKLYPEAQFNTSLNLRHFILLTNDRVVTKDLDIQIRNTVGMVNEINAYTPIQIWKDWRWKRPYTTTVYLLKPNDLALLSMSLEKLPEPIPPGEARTFFTGKCWVIACVGKDSTEQSKALLKLLAGGKL